MLHLICGSASPIIFRGNEVKEDKAKVTQH